MIDVATLLCVLVKYAVAKLHMLYLNVFRQSIGIRATIKTCFFCVYLREPGDTYNNYMRAMRRRGSRVVQLLLEHQSDFLMKGHAIPHSKCIRITSYFTDRK